jgi:4-diphosphocytidyl-2-C-methyl-D-erythritol kinase
VTLLESVSIADEVCIATLDERGADRVRCPGVEGPNIVSRALEDLRARGWTGPPVSVEIAKRIPVAAGMGGGSADAAAVLRVAQQLHARAEAELQEVAAEVGSDVPGQLRPGLALGSGAGDRVDRLHALAPHAFVIVPLPHQLSTAAVYSEADRLDLARPPVELERKRAELMSEVSAGAQLPDELIVNDLQPAAVSLCPPISSALAAVRDAGADHAIVSGSGPTVFGLFWGGDSPTRARAAERTISERFSGAESAVAVDADFSRPWLSAQSDH